MSKSYTPGLKVLEKISIQKERILPLRGKVHVNEGDRVDANDVVASTEIPGNVQMLNVANELNIDPDQVSECMLCSVDEHIEKGQIIALIGETGNSNGPHLHFEIWKNNQVLDPREIIPEYKKKDVSIR